MDIDSLRGFATIACMVGFLTVVVWAYAPSRRKQFDDAAQLPFIDDEASDIKP